MKVNIIDRIRSAMPFDCCELRMSSPTRAFLEVKRRESGLATWEAQASTFETLAGVPVTLGHVDLWAVEFMTPDGGFIFKWRV
jgi:hypothetical protein